MGTELPEDHHALSLCLLWPTCEGALPTRLYSDCLRGVAQLGSAGALGALGRRFESCRPDSENLLFAMGLAII